MASLTVSECVAGVKVGVADAQQSIADQRPGVADPRLGVADPRLGAGGYVVRNLGPWMTPRGSER